MYINYTVGVHKYHTNCSLTFETFIRNYHFCADRDLYLHLGGAA